MEETTRHANEPDGNAPSAPPADTATTADAIDEAAAAQTDQGGPAIPQGDQWDEGSGDPVVVQDAEQEPPAGPSAPVEEAASPATATEEAEASPADQPDLTLEQAAALVEAVLFASDTPLTIAKIAQVTKVSGQKATKQAIAALNLRYEQAGGSFRIESIAGGFQMLTQPQYNEVLGRLLRVRSETKLSQASMETLAIVAYRQPILRADIEAIRGVASGEVLRSLMERNMVKIVGRADVVGRPMLYGTTRKFLEVFGLGSLEDLPKAEELKKPSALPAPAAAPAAPSPAAATTPPASVSPVPAAKAGADPTPSASEAQQEQPAIQVEPGPAMPDDQSRP